MVMFSCETLNDLDIKDNFGIIKKNNLINV